MWFDLFDDCGVNSCWEERSRSSRVLLYHHCSQNLLYCQLFNIVGNSPVHVNTFPNPHLTNQLLLFSSLLINGLTKLQYCVVSMNIFNCICLKAESEIDCVSRGFKDLDEQSQSFYEVWESWTKYKPSLFLFHVDRMVWFVPSET